MVQVHFCIYKCLRLDTIQASTSIIIIVTSYIFIKYILLYQKWYIFGLDYNIIQWTVFDCHSHKNIYLGVSQTFFCQSVQFTLFKSNSYWYNQISFAIKNQVPVMSALKHVSVPLSWFSNLTLTFVNYNNYYL